MASYLSRLIERAGGEPTPEDRADAIMPAPETVDSAPTTLDPFEETVVEEPQPPDSVLPSPEDGDPLPAPQPPAPPGAPSPVNEQQEPLMIDGLPLPPPTEPPTPFSPASQPETENVDGLPERILIERWREGEPPSIDLPPPVIEREVIITPPDADDELPISDLPVPPSPEARVPEPIDLPPPEPAADLPPPVITERPDVALNPPDSPPIDTLDAAGEASPSITIGDVIVEIVATKRQPEPARRTPAPVLHAPERPAPRHGVRSKRRFGLGQS